jgi:hypothetical protein
MELTRADVAQPTRKAKKTIKPMPTVLVIGDLPKKKEAYLHVVVREAFSMGI